MTLTLSGVCGLFCRACPVYIATREAPERLRPLAERFGVTSEEMACDGCRSNRRGVACRSCEFVPCAKAKDVDFCVACDEYPCERLVRFKDRKPHRIELWEDNERIRTAGFETWFDEMVGHYSCKVCDRVNSSYDLVCRDCGGEPASEFIAKHGEIIREHWKRINRQEG